MMSNQMTQIENSEKITNFLSQLFSQKNKILLWQKISESNRISHSVKIKNYDIEKNEISFLPKKGLFFFDNNQPIYFYSKKRNVIFKNNIYFNTKLNLIVKSPPTLFLEEGRQKKRIEYANNTEMIEIILDDGNQIGNSTQFKRGLIDLSDNGFSFKANFNSVFNFKVGQKIKYKSKNMKNYAEGTVVYSATQLQKINLSKYSRIGVRF